MQSASWALRVALCLLRLMYLPFYVALPDGKNPAKDNGYKV